MTFAPGQDWGGYGPLPRDGVVVASDREAREVVEAARRAGDEIPPLGLIGGDLGRALGAGTDPDRLRRPDAAQVRIDLGSVSVDGRRLWFVSHLVARRSWWRGRIVAVMNTEWLGSWRVAPRAHPGDGRLDLVDADPPWRDRIAARRRLPSGDHLPHPDIRTRSLTAERLELDPPLRVELDGMPVGEARVLSVRVEPGALLVVV